MRLFKGLAFVVLAVLQACCHTQPPIVRTVVETRLASCLESVPAPPQPQPFSKPSVCDGKVCWEPHAASVYQSNYEALEEWSKEAWTRCKPSE